MASDSPSKVKNSATQLSVDNNKPYSGLSTKDLTDVMWDTSTAIDALRWNQNYPYQLLIVKTTNTSYKEIASFTLPINPQDLNISMDFATNLTVSLGGIIEENNGAPLRQISFSGTTGLKPLATADDTHSPNKPGIQGIFGGTLAAATGVAQAATNLIRPLNLYQETDFQDSADLGKTTGYYQFRLLQRFLENYATLKKSAKGFEYRMVFAAWKDQATYFVTPMNFSVRRSVSKPLSYDYSFNLVGWKRQPIDLGKVNQVSNFTPLKNSPTEVSKALNTLKNARSLVAKTAGTLQAVRTDISSALWNPLRESVMFLKDNLGLAVTIADLPASLVKDMAPPIIAAFGVRDFARKMPNSVRAEYAGVIKQLTAAAQANDLQTTFNANLTKPQFGVAKSASTDASGSGRPTGTKTPPPPTTISNGPDPALDIFNDPTKNPDFFDAIQPSDLNLSQALQDKISAEKDRVRRLRRLDFEQMRDTMVAVLSDFERSIGLGDDDYSEFYNYSTTIPTRTATDDDIEVMMNLNDIIIQFDALAATDDLDNDIVTALQYTEGLATRSGIAFTVPTSKFLVPFLYGHTLEQMSDLYLGTPDRWFEIAALNGLQAPYVDETGFSIPLLTNGFGNQIMLGTANNLFVGQPVFISSQTVRRSPRRIVAIKKISVDNWLVTLDGDSNLSSYTTLAGSVLEAFLPNTVNSQKSIYIPSPDPAADDDFYSKAIPTVDYFDDMVRVGGVDLLLSAENDLIFTEDGDTRLAIGYTNLVQRVRLAIQTPRGSVLTHPDYGMGLPVGQQTGDNDINVLKKTLKNLLEDDDAFSGVSNVSVVKDGNTLRLNLNVKVAGVSKLIPLSFNLKS